MKSGIAPLHATLAHTRAPWYRRAGGPWDRPVLDASFPLVRSTAVVEGSTRLDGAALEAVVAALAGRLRAAGGGRGRVVAWQLPNGPASLAMYRACWRIGATAAPLHHRLGPIEAAGALDQVRPVAVLASSDMPASGYPSAIALAPHGSVEELMAALPDGMPVARASCPSMPHDLAVVLFTSGSTGRPKAVLHTQRALAYKAALMLDVHGLRQGDAVLMPAPLAHVSGLLNGVLIPAMGGLPTVLMATWDPAAALDAIERERITFMGAPPVFFSQIAADEHFTRERVASMRLISTGGAAVSPAFVEQTADAFACSVKRTYGSTEAPTVTTSTASDRPEHARETDGRPLGDVELQIRVASSAKQASPGEVGEIWLRGPELFAGYVDRVATAKALAEPGGWFRTGDLGTLDSDGWLRVTGRLSDIIIRAGENISAAEVEAILEAHPSIHQAVAVAAPDPAVGERVVAFVTSSAPFDLEACRAWFAESGATRFKTPEVVVALDEIPSLAAGKPDRAALRQMARQLA